MFAMFCLGLVIGAMWLATCLVFCSTKPDAYKVSVLLLLLTVLVSQWIIADNDRGAQKQYQQLSGGKGDGL